MDNFLPSELRQLRESGNDFYIEPKMTAEALLQILKLQEDVVEDIDFLEVPTFMITAENDDQADTDKSKEVFDSLQNAMHKKYISI